MTLEQFPNASNGLFELSVVGTDFITFTFAAVWGLNRIFPTYPVGYFAAPDFGWRCSCMSEQ